MTLAQSIQNRLTIARANLAQDTARLYANGMCRHTAEIEWLESQLTTSNDNQPTGAMSVHSENT